MALSATLRRIVITMADSDRGVYETLDLRVAQHPSESARYLVARVLARALEHGEGVDFSKGLAASEEPAIFGHNLRGEVTSWIEVGSPSLERLHRASKTGARIVVYAWRGAEALAHGVIGAVHRAAEVEVRALDAAFLDGVAESLERKNAWSLTVSGGELYLDVAGSLFQGSVRKIPIAPA